MFKSEQELVRCFLAQLVESRHLHFDESCVQVSSEFNYARGRTDVVALSQDGEVFAFEAKLSKWRVALHQAFRNTCFSDRSYVVLPMETALRARQYEHEFDIRKVGLIGISGCTASQTD